MSEQAIETDEEIEVLETPEGVTFSDPDEFDEVVDEAAESIADAADKDVTEAVEEELEIVIEGEDEPTSAPVRKSGFYKRLSKVTGQRDVANDKADEANLRAEAAEEENKLLRLKLNTDSPLKRPKPEDFETDAEFDAAKDKYDDARLEALADEKFAKRMEEAKGQTTQTQQRSQFEGNLREHYAQADKLKIKDFEEAEDQVVDIIGNELLQYIVNYHGEKSAAMIYKLSKNPVKAQEFYDLSITPGQAPVLSQRLTRFEDSVKIRTKHTAANPETEIEKSAPSGDALLGARFE